MTAAGGIFCCARENIPIWKMALWSWHAEAPYAWRRHAPLPELRHRCPLPIKRECL